MRLAWFLALFGLGALGLHLGYEFRASKADCESGCQCMVQEESGLLKQGHKNVREKKKLVVEQCVYGTAY